MNRNGTVLELVLVRHGMTRWNAERRYLGHSDIGLLPEACTGLARLKAELAYETFDAVYCSDLVRCRETLLCIRPDLAEAAAYDSRLREMNFGGWEGCTYEMLRHNPDYRAWIDDPKQTTPPGGESWDMFEGRVKSYMLDLRRKARAFAGEYAARYPAKHGGNAEQAEHAEQVEYAEHAGHAIKPGPEPDLELARDKPDSVQDDVSFRALIVTHGGVIRLLKSLYAGGLPFREQTAEPGKCERLRVLC
ncbi:histidine phosphatase family protein [Paenibacillus caui]|uniref:histidine phosphatase family protein n=1 Tax=Paenibacillus caui TaxID=2873927 RepID=UPI001CA93AC2|nr:histidine phosphatase family protein [Paenibacillus caui]